MKRRTGKRITTAFLLLCLMLSLVTGCRSQETPQTVTLFALDTYVTITATGPDAEQAVAFGASEVSRYEQLLSRHLPGSEIDRLNHAASDSPITISDETYAFLSEVLSLSEKTEGRFDPTVAPLMDVWGFGEERTTVPDPSVIEAALRTVDYHGVHLLEGNQAYLDTGTILDLGGAAKGYIADRVMEGMRGYKVTKIILDLGGNICFWNQKREMHIGVISPLDPQALIVTYSAKEGSVVTSGAYERYQEIDGVRYGHIMDTNTGYPVETDLLSVTVIDPDGTKADVLATALFAMGQDEAMRVANEMQVVCILCDGNGTLWISSDLRGHIENEKGWTVEYF